MFVASINGWLLLRVTKAKVAVALAATAVMLLIMGSPIVFASAAITLTIFVWDKGASIQSRVATVLAVVLTSTFFVAFYDEAALSNVVERVERIGDRGSTDELRVSSENLRFVIPYLTLAELNSTSGLGPVAALGVVVGLAAMITLLPALLVICGRWLFWPVRPKFGTAEPTATGFWAKLGGRITRRPRTVWIGTALALGVLALGLVQLKADGLSTADSFTTKQPSVTGGRYGTPNTSSGIWPRNGSSSASSSAGGCPFAIMSEF